MVHAVEIRPIFFEALMVTNLATGLVTLSVALTLYAAAHGDSAGGDNLSLLDGAQGGVRGIIGKGGLAEGSLKQFEKSGQVYFQAAPGCAVSLAEGIERIDGVYFLEHGVPEALWILRAKKFGPLVVGMDSHGKSIYAEIKKSADARNKELYG